jgi:hypothetical protein
MNNLPLPGPSKVAEITIFNLIWKTRERKSFLTGTWLRTFEDSPLFFNCFAHVLAKGQNKYPYFKYYMKNIVLLTPGEHALLDQGTEEARISYALEVEERSGGKITADWPKLKALEQELLGEYKKYFPSTRGLMIGQKYNLMEQQAIIGMLNERYMESLKKKA